MEVNCIQEVNSVIWKLMYSGRPDKNKNGISLDAFKWVIRIPSACDVVWTINP